MAIVTLTNIKKAYGSRGLLADCSFLINRGERVALVGANGTGKTTLLRMIAGQDAPDAGTISVEPGTTVGYLPQEVDLPDLAPLQIAVMGVTSDLLRCASELAAIEKQLAVASAEQAQALGARLAEISHLFDTLGGFDYQIKARGILLGLGFEESDCDKPVRSLSGGQKVRAALARLLLLSPDLLLLDEPTNHLDANACEWLQEFVQTRFQGAALIVSHDRYFLDRVVSKVVEIDDGIVVAYKGNYTAFARQKSAATEERRRLYKAQRKEIARIESAIQTLFSQRKFSRRDSKVKQLERMQRAEQVRERRTISARLQSSVRSGREVVRLAGLAKSFPGKELFAGVNVVVERGRKVGIVGPNGSGKTTMLKIIAGIEQPDAGEVIVGHNVRAVYFAQEFDHLVPSRSVLEELLSDADLTAAQARDLLARFLFLGDDAFKSVGVLSGGEQCRLALAKVLATAPNLLLLDEPTNHLDIPSREALEDALRTFDGTLMVASHDRYLLNAIADEIHEISDGRFRTCAGSYSEYRDRLAAEQPAPPAQAAPDPPKERPVSALREKERLVRTLGRKQRAVEREIEQVEARLQELASALGSEQSYRSGAARELDREYEHLSARLEILYSDWELVCRDLAAAQEDGTDSVREVVAIEHDRPCFRPSACLVEEPQTGENTGFGSYRQALVRMLSLTSRCRRCIMLICRGIARLRLPPFVLYEKRGDGANTMIYPEADKLENWGSKYSLVVLAAKRAKQLKSGAPSLIHTDSRNPLTIALEEIAAGKVICAVPDTDAPPVVIEQPEVAALLAIPSASEEAEEAAEPQAEPAAAASGETAVGVALDEEEEIEEHEEEEEEEEEDIEDDLLVHDDEETGFADEAPVGLGADLEEDVLAQDDEKPTGRRRSAAKADVVLPVEADDVEIDADEVDIDEAAIPDLNDELDEHEIEEGELVESEEEPEEE